ncbi:MAG: hypothetical protein A3I78_00055 [Gammaproteobacteria bacterium RIFCSPLOWO2_02_FULL_56_15]|nr:MAG: hypothetical protein A3I78_00055 [Gammaproteobacteria bacterium RIFCSPLOWO2_02_FULL_56_15]
MKLSRRGFLIGAGLVGGGLVIGFRLKGSAPVPGVREGSFQPNAYLQITPDDNVIFQMARAEMGQGVYHGMTTIIAEELDIDPARVEVELAGVHPGFALAMGQLTGGSMSVAMGWEPLRNAGALARALLVAAAASRWGVDRDRVETEDGVVSNRNTGEKLRYGDLVEDARAMDPDVDFVLKDPADFRWIGREAPRIDGYLKSTGKAIFGMDVSLPGLKTAVVLRPPQFGGQVRSWNADTVRELPGVIQAFEIHTGIAIVADSYWEARQAAGNTHVEWDKGPLAGLDSEKIRKELLQGLEAPEPHEVVDEGDTATAFAGARQLLDAVYMAPFLPHSTMEPQNATALVRGESCEMWVPSQAPDMTRAVVAFFTGLRQEAITIHSTLLGGGFGRRGYVDFAGEAAVIAQKIPDVPIKVIWSREDDMQHDYYRPASCHGIKGALDADGRLVAWEHRVVSSSIFKGLAPNMAMTALPAFVPSRMAESIGRSAGDLIDQWDPMTSEGAHIPYAVPNIKVSQVLSEQGIPVGFWRSVGNSHTAFVAESFMDEMAHAALADPVKFRRTYLTDKPRHLAVLNLAVEKSGWGNAPPGRYQGVAVHECFRSFVAMVVEVTVSGSDYAVERVVAAVDCGLAVNPNIVRAQVESSIVYGLTAAIKDPITIEDGAVRQSNFHDAPVLRINEAPRMEVYIVDSVEAPTGIGEPGLPPLAPALANALFAATGQRLRELPLRLA